MMAKYIINSYRLFLSHLVRNSSWADLRMKSVFVNNTHFIMKILEN